MMSDAVFRTFAEMSDAVFRTFAEIVNYYSMLIYEVNLFPVCKLCNIYLQRIVQLFSLEVLPMLMSNKIFWLTFRNKEIAMSVKSTA